MVVTVRNQAGVGEDEQENNQQSYSFDTHIKSTTGRHRVYVHIVSANDNPKVRLYLYGLTANMAQVAHTHTLTTLTTSNASQSFSIGPSQHTHTLSGTTDSTGNITDGTSIPLSVQIHINGVNKTETIGDPNGQGAAHYDSVNYDWGVSAEWETGELDLSSAITWSVGSHYIELLCTGNGGRLVGSVLVN